jgi:hypothetical protein
MTKFNPRPTLDQAEKFIGAAEEEYDRLPWADLDPRVMKGFNLRLSEVELAKLQFIKEHRPGSIQGFIKKVVLAAIDKEIQAIIEEKK